jgi:hypothetical protein
MIDALLIRCLVIGITQNSLYNLVAQCILKLSHKTGQRYTTLIKEPEQDNPEVIIMVVKNESNSYFHMAITGINASINNAKAVCSQAVLYRSLEDNPDLYYSIYDSLTQIVFFCLCSPSKQEFGDMAYYLMHREVSKVA